MLGDVGNGAAIFAAEAQALHYSQGEENEGGGDADRLEGWDQADQPGAQSHAAQRYEKRIFAADPVAQPSKQERSQRTDQEPRREQRDRAQQGCDGVGLFEELDRQDGG